MAFTDDAAFIERLQFFNGQRLFAEDLQGLEMGNREMRWWHNRSLHQPGIGSGFAVSGKQEDREVIIQPGYAVDAKGREIVLTRAKKLPIPPVASDEKGNPVSYDLTVSYPDDAELEETELRQGICNPPGVVRRREEPVFCWVPLQSSETGTLQEKSATLKDDIKSGLRIVLARAEIVNCQLKQPVSILQRQSARPANLPYIASGMAKGIAWKFETQQTPSSWSVNFNDKIPFIIRYPLIANVVTASGGFITTPHYSAHIVGERFFKEKIENGEQKYSCIIDGLLNIAELTSTTFKVEVWLIAQLLDTTPEGIGINVNPDEFEKIIADWQIAWMGVES